MIFGGIHGASLVLVCASYATAFSIPSIRSDKVDGVVKVPLTVNRTSAYEFNVTTHRLVDYYWIDLAVGSNKQVVSVIVDSGSSDLVLATDSYDPSSSSTSKQSDWSIFDWGTYFEVYYDTVSLGELTVENFTVGRGGDSLNLVGIGPRFLTEQVPSANYYYENFPLALRDSGYIKSAAFSLYLETFSSSVVQAGSILFGGIDHAKYTGELVAHPYTAGQIDITISVKGIKFADGLFHPIDYPVLLDTGTVTLAFPDAYIAEIQSAFGPTYQNGTLINHQDWKSIYFSVDFGNQVITIPYYDLLIPDGAGGYKLTHIYSSEKDIGRNISIFGDTFIRNAYTVYNYDEQTILLAQINYNANGASNISVI